MQSIESFLEENQVYEMMEDLLKQIIVARPDDPLAFLLQKIKQNPGKYKSKFTCIAAYFSTKKHDF